MNDLRQVAFHIGRKQEIKNLVHFLGDYLFIIEKTQSEKNTKMVNDTYKSLLYSQAYNKPFFCTERMLRYLVNIKCKLYKKFREFYKGC